MTPEQEKIIDYLITNANVGDYDLTIAEGEAIAGLRAARADRARRGGRIPCHTTPIFLRCVPAYYLSPRGRQSAETVPRSLRPSLGYAPDLGQELPYTRATGLPHDTGR